jgi:hypothetical protein
VNTFPTIKQSPVSKCELQLMGRNLEAKREKRKFGAKTRFKKRHFDPNAEDLGDRGQEIVPIDVVNYFSNAFRIVQDDDFQDDEDRNLFYNKLVQGLRRFCLI